MQGNRRYEETAKVVMDSGIKPEAIIEPALLEISKQTK
jgi:hypothetical protein